jgi:hypothetical protein
MRSKAATTKSRMDSGKYRCGHQSSAIIQTHIARLYTNGKA